MKIHFAPLQGYTDLAYRKAHQACFASVDLYHSPFVRIEKGEIRRKDIKDVDPLRNEGIPFIPQFIANDAQKAETIVSFLVSKGYKNIEINLGCPFPPMALKHNGAGMLPHKDEVESILGLSLKYSEVSFALKMRLGWQDENECLTLAPILEKYPLAYVTLHPRLGIQQYKGDVNLKAFQAFYESCNLPLVYNGDIKTVEDIQVISKKFPKLSGIMIGRGLLSNPALAEEYKLGTKLDDKIKMEKLKAMHTKLYTMYEEELEGGEKQLLTKLKTFWEYLEPCIGHKAWKAIHKSSNLAKYQQAIQLAFTIN